jgi:hypothetical protein
MAFEIPAAEPTPEELARECREAADNAAEWIRSMSGIELDFSPPSLVVLDKVLEQLVQTLSRDDHEVTVVLLGSYLGEVILRTFGGRWETGDIFTGPGLRGLAGKEITISPFSRIRQALTNIEPSHLASYWNVVIERINKSEALDDTSGFKLQPDMKLKKLPVKGDGVPKGPTDKELGEIIPEETKQFIAILKQDLGVELDYTLDSLKFLDHFFRSLNDKVGKTGGVADQRVLIYLAGNYLGEVLRRAYGGEWVFVGDQQTTAIIMIKGNRKSTIFPHKAAAEMVVGYRDGGVMDYARKVEMELKINR